MISFYEKFYYDHVNSPKFHRYFKKKNRTKFIFNVEKNTINIPKFNHTTDRAAAEFQEGKVLPVKSCSYLKNNFTFPSHDTNCYRNCILQQFSYLVLLILPAFPILFRLSKTVGDQIYFPPKEIPI